MARKKRRTKARDFGDNPHVRRSHGEAEQINPREPWERQYAGIKKASGMVRAHYRKKQGGGRTLVRRHIRHYV